MEKLSLKKLCVKKLIAEVQSCTDCQQYLYIAEYDISVFTNTNSSHSRRNNLHFEDGTQEEILPIKIFNFKIPNTPDQKV